jgi:hypothetical protein
VRPSRARNISRWSSFKFAGRFAGLHASIL